MSDRPSGEPEELAIRNAGALPATLQTLVQAAREYVRKADASRTEQAYRAQWQSFVGWCARHDLSPLPARPETLLLYLTARAQEGRKVATLAQAMAAISKAHARAGHPSPRS